MASPTDEAIKARIISHMNKDHQDSLSRYLEAYGGVSHFSARSPKLEDLTVSSLKISSAAVATKLIPISPPLSSLLEARPRFVAMHEECGRQLGRDAITVTRFRWPGIIDISIIAGVVVGLALLTNGSNFAPGSFLARTLFKSAPRWASFMERNHWYIWWGIVLLHFGEAGLMAVWLKKYNVQPLSTVWNLYVGFTVLEGVGCGSRLRAEVSSEKALKQRKEAKEGLH